MTQKIVGREEWLAARKAFLAKEKAFTHQREALARERRELPWVKVEKAYMFEGVEGRLSFADLFGGHGQLVIYHFMFGPDWQEGCPSCSFWADNYNGVEVHLAHRDTALIAISRTSVAKIEAYKKRMGWNFRWVSSEGNDFNFDYGVSFKPEAGKKHDYNYGSTQVGGEEMPGISAFRRGDDGAIYHTYSTYGRGLDIANGAYHLLDLTSKGRDEAGLPWNMAWVRRRDQY